jgi:SAM-dependent methyltransferase
MMSDTNLHEQIAQLVSRIAHKSSLDILDWGCGQGALSQRMHDQGHTVLSVDLDEANYAAKGPVFRQLDFEDSDAVNAFVSEFQGKFDVILAIETIEHVEDPWSYMRTLGRLARHDTEVILTTPNIGSWIGRVNFLLFGEHYGFSRENWRDIGHINPLTALEMMGIFDETGYEVVGTYLAGELPIVWLSTWKKTLATLLGILLRPLMRGTKDGFAICFHVRRR